jgi:Tol biopolymer transport system component/sugar lactone lactonase YvrE
MTKQALLFLMALVSVSLYCTKTDDVAASSAGAKEWISYSSLRPGNWDIYHFTSRGAAPRRLTDHPGLDYDAVFSPDGKWVVFTSERRGNPDLYAIDLQQEGTPTPQLLIDSPVMEDQAAFSPDGSTIAFVSTHTGNADVYTIPFKPTKTQYIENAANLTNHSGGDFRPSFSPDGQRIAFSTDRDTPPFGHPFFGFAIQREGDLYVMNRDGENIRRLTQTPGWDGSPKWSPDGQTIYFYSERPRESPNPPASPILGQEGGFRIWAIAADGSNPRAITPPGTEALAPVVTPDGHVAFQTRTGVADWKIKSVAPDGSDVRLESDEATNYWNPDFNAKTNSMVCHGVGPAPQVGTQGVDEVILGPGPLLASDFPADVQLPDRTVTLYPLRHSAGLGPNRQTRTTLLTIEDRSGSRVVLADFDGSNERTLFEIPGVGRPSGSPNRVLTLNWSNDSNWITYTIGSFLGGPDTDQDVWVIGADGSNGVNLTAESNSNDGFAAFSPDGTRLVFRSSRSGNFDIYTMNVDGSDVRQLTNDPAKDNFPAFSPDGRSIVFTSDRDGIVDQSGSKTSKNYVLDLRPDGSPGTLRRINNHPGQDGHPEFSPDGQWIVYTSERGGISDEEPLVQEVIFAPQMYGQIWASRLSDGLNVRLTHNKWEEGGLAIWGTDHSPHLNPTPARALGDSQVIAQVPLPGFPEGIATRGNRFYVSGPADPGPLGSAFVHAYDIRTGDLEATYPITITNSSAETSAALCAAFGPDGKLYVIEPFVGVIRMNLDSSNKQSVYSAFTPTDPSLLNDLVFDNDGNLYVTNSFQATIFRVPPGGGTPVVWFTDPRLEGDPFVPFGVNGIRIDKNNEKLYVSVTAENGTLDGVIYRLPLVDSPTAADLEEFYRYRGPGMPVLPVPGPDGIAFGESGKLYVALAGTSQISVLRPDGTEEEARYLGPAANPEGALNPMPWANPANIAFDDHEGALLVTNHANLVPFDPSLFAVFDVFVDDKGQPLP